MTTLSSRRSRIDGDAGTQPARPRLRGLVIGLGLVVFGASFSYVPNTASRAVLLLVGSCAGYWAFVRWFERRRCRELLGGWTAMAQLSLGGALGTALAAVPLVEWWSTGLARVVTLNSFATFSLTLDALAFLGAVAAFEELLFRGVILRYLELSLGSWPALATSAVLFGLVHLADPYVGVLRIADCALAGLVLGAAYLITRRLWLPIGIHALYNVVTALLIGSEETIPLVKLAFSGNPYWTSQAGVYALFATGDGALALVLILIAWKRGSFVSRRAAWGRQIGPVS